jgi:hypothetical protein
MKQGVERIIGDTYMMGLDYRSAAAASYARARRN